MLCLRVVEFWAHRWPFVSKVSDRPLAGPMARYQPGLGETITNLRHEAGRLDEFGRMVLRHLDGTRDRAEILGLLRASRFADRPDRALEAERDRCLETLARYAFLMG